MPPLLFLSKKFWIGLLLPSGFKSYNEKNHYSNVIEQGTVKQAYSEVLVGQTILINYKNTFYINRVHDVLKLQGTKITLL